MSDRTMRVIAEECHAVAKKSGWWTSQRAIPEMLMLMVTELAEAMEEYRNGHTAKDVYYRADGKPEGFGVELADTVIRIFDVATGLGIDITDLVEVKIAYNKTRPYRHGGKIA